MGSYSHALTQWQPQAQRGIADVIQRIQGRDRLQDLGSARPGHYDIHTHTEQPKRYKHGKILLSKIISHKLKFYLFLGLLYNYTMFVGSTQILVSWWLNIRCLQVGSPFCLVESPASVASIPLVWKLTWHHRNKVFPWCSIIFRIVLSWIAGIFLIFTNILNLHLSFLWLNPLVG